MKVKYKLLWIVIVVNCLISVNAFSEDPTLAGKSIFTSHCASCHHLGSVLVGPDLSNVEKRHSIDWIINFVKSSQSMVKKGDKDAALLFNNFKIVMPDQADLKEGDIKNIISYINSASVVNSADKAPLSTPFIASVHYLPLTKNNYAYIIFYLVSVTLLVMALFFAVTVQVLGKHLPAQEIMIKEIL